MGELPFRLKGICIILVLILGFLLGSRVLFGNVTFEPVVLTQATQSASVATASPPPSNESISSRILLTGDIMLGRYVEQLMREHGDMYAFEHFTSFFHEYDLVVGNFESAAPDVHVPTPLFNMRFSTPQEYFALLNDVGFDVLSLANNHSLDYGASGYAQTRSACEAYTLECFGRPDSVEGAVIDVGGVAIGILFVHALSPVSLDDIEAALAPIRMQSDVQIAYVHWGTEYIPTHNTVQESLAHILIERGIDAVVGHHPHVVQDIAIYKGAPIFYSLGNFIFDQYFSSEVQEGALLEVHIENTSVVFRVIPIESHDVRSQPTFAHDKDTKRILEHMFTHIAHDDRVDVEKGTITLEY